MGLINEFIYTHKQQATDNEQSVKLSPAKLIIII